MFMVILNLGDEVLVLVFYWVSYLELIKLVDGVLVFVEILRENNYKYIIVDLEKFVINKIKVILINSFNNLIGIIYYEEELK